MPSRALFFGSQGHDVGADQRYQQLERRVTQLEAPSVSRAIATADFTASEGETIIIAGPTTGLRALLPKPTTRNRSARITLIFTNSNPVAIRCVGGTMNGQAVLSRNVTGSYVAISDGNDGWWVQSLNPPRPRQLEIQDYFISGGITTGTIGALGWGLNGVGTPAVTRNSVSLTSSAKLSLTTSGAANDRSSLTLGSAEGTTISAPEDVFLTQGIFDFNSDTTNKRVFFGFATSMATAPASVANSLGFLYDSSVDGNIYTIHRFGSTGTATTTGIAASAAAGSLFTIWQVTPTTYELRIGGTVVATIPQNLNVSTLPLSIGWRLETLAAAAKTIRIGYFGMSSVTLDGPYDDDEFLKR